MMKNKIIYYLLNLLAFLWIVIFSFSTFFYLINNNLSENDKIPSITDMYRLKKQDQYIIEVNKCISGQNEAFITSGPYLTMLPGRYTITYKVKGLGRIYIDTATKNGNKLFFYNFSDINKSDIISIDRQFELPDMIKDFEARSKFVSGQSICVDKIILNREYIDWYKFIKQIVLKIYNET